MMIPNRFLFGFCLLFALTSIAGAQTTEKLPAQFDLVIFGSNLDANSTRVWLKENPGSNNNWQQLDSEQVISPENDQFSSMVFRNLPSEKFAGQDIRENYIAIKIAGGEQGELRAIYALPSIDNPENESANKLHVIIKNDPQQILSYSIASYTRPRPISISGESEFVEHIEMPVRHLKPGIQEVKWLDVIFSGE